MSCVVKKKPQTKEDKTHIFNIFKQIIISLKYFNHQNSISIMSVRSNYSSQFPYVSPMIRERITTIQTNFNWITKQNKKQNKTKKPPFSNFLTFLTNQNRVKEIWEVIEEYVLIYFR